LTAANKGQAKKGGPKVPSYIVTFSDMVTLLLTFFVMLQSMARVRDEELFDKGRDSFMQSLNSLGLGILQGRKQRPDLGYDKIRYYVDKPDKSFNNRTIHANQEKLRRVFKKMTESVKTMRSQITGKQTAFSVTNIRFSPGTVTLSEKAHGSLSRFASHLRSIHRAENSIVYVIGFAADEKTDRRQWILSAQRAELVAEFLQEALNRGPPSQIQSAAHEQQPKWTVFSWGAGAGSYWVDEHATVSLQPDILIGVLKKGI